MNGPSSHNYSPTSRLIYQHYYAIGVMKGWDSQRAHRLAGLLRTTIHELGVLCAVKPSQLTRYLNRDRFSSTVSLHMAILEGWYLSEVMGGQCAPVVPLNVLADRFRAPGIESRENLEQGLVPVIEHREPILPPKTAITPALSPAAMP